MCVFFFNDTATTEIYTLSLHDALPISCHPRHSRHSAAFSACPLNTPESCAVNLVPKPWRVADDASLCNRLPTRIPDRKSTRLNSRHAKISYAVFCSKKKKKHLTPLRPR